jgi:hypothetical protein
MVWNSHLSVFYTIGMLLPCQCCACNGSAVWSVIKFCRLNLKLRTTVTKQQIVLLTFH